MQTQRPRTSKPTPKHRGTADRTTDYARRVAAGKILVNRYVTLACERFLRDLKRGDLVWSPNRAARAFGFIESLKLAGGEFEGRPFRLQPWQAFMTGNLFGWLLPDGRRRFRDAYCEIAKGSGKTPWAAAVGLYMLVADGEPRAEVYALGPKRDQASIAFRDVVAMVDQSPALLARLKKSGAEGNVWALSDLETGSFFRTMSSEDRLSGLRPHCVLIDEVHEHRTDHVIDKMRANVKGRRQPLVLEITNSGVGRETICGRHHEYSKAILEDVVKDDGWFAFVCGLDEGDEWTDERVWPKANPGIAIHPGYDYVRRQVQAAKGMPPQESLVRRLNMCQWVEEAGRAISLDDWRKGDEPIDPQTLRGRVCYGGLDLARVNDLSAFVLLFPPESEGERWKVLSWFWVPQDDIGVRVRRDRVPYDSWSRNGFLTATPGNTTDFTFIAKTIVELAGLYSIREIGFDRTFAGEIVQELMAEGLTMVQFGQGFLSMAAPTAELLRLVLAGELQHGDQPVMTWCAANLVVATDPAGSLKPDKERSPEKIDGISALCNALGLAMRHPIEPEPSIHFLSYPNGAAK